MLLLEPACTKPELDPAAAHRVDLRNRDRKRPRKAESCRSQQGPEPNPLGVASEARERQPGVGRTRSRVPVAHGEEVV